MTPEETPQKLDPVGLPHVIVSNRQLSLLFKIQLNKSEPLIETSLMLETPISKRSPKIIYDVKSPKS